MSYAAVSHICLMGPIYHDISKKIIVILLLHTMLINENIKIFTII